MNFKNISENTGTWIIKIFLFGLIIHFLIQTWVTFGLHIQNTLTTILRLWKEIFIFALIGLLVYLGKNKSFLKTFFSNKVITNLEIIWCITVLFTFLLTIFKGISIGTFFLAFKYDFIGFLIFFVFYHFGQILPAKLPQKVFSRYVTVMKWLLVIAILRYLVIMIKPGALKYLGYNKNTFEGEAGQQPPAVYYTQLNQGFARNQFVFERPINWGFYLIAFWPLFYLFALRKQPIKKTWGWWLLFGLNLMLTYSRAAWGAWIIELAVIGYNDFRGAKKKYTIYIIAGVLLVIGALAFFAKDQIISRDYSNTGHLKLFEQGLKMFWEHPFAGQGAASVGPGSYQGGISFNPENQFLQIMIEFGVIGFIMRMRIYVFFNTIGFKLYFDKSSKSKDNSTVTPTLVIVSLSLGMIGITLCGFVLHSFSDRMIVYPLMALFGIAFARITQIKSNK